MAHIQVTHEGGDDYRVEVEDDRGTSTHRVTVTDRHLQTYGAGADAEALVQESFRFLLEREPKESILSSFDLPVIERYFPEYPDEIRDRMS